MKIIIYDMNKVIRTSIARRIHDVLNIDAGIILGVA